MMLTDVKKGSRMNREPFLTVLARALVSYTTGLYL